MTDKEAKKAVKLTGIVLTMAQVVAGLFAVVFFLTAIEAALNHNRWPRFVVCLVGFVAFSALRALSIRLDASRWTS